MMKILYSFFVFLFFASCSEQKTHPYTFYFWKTNLTLDKTEKKALEESTADFLYTRFFDVDKIDGQFEPIAVITKTKVSVQKKRLSRQSLLQTEHFMKLKVRKYNFLLKALMI